VQLQANVIAYSTAILNLFINRPHPWLNPMMILALMRQPIEGLVRSCLVSTVVRES
jgi:hypothetical protein